MSIFLNVQHYTSSVVVKQVALPLYHQKRPLKDIFYTKVYALLALLISYTNINHINIIPKCNADFILRHPLPKNSKKLQLLSIDLLAFKKSIE
jgi:hypothetical protein